MSVWLVYRLSEDLVCWIGIEPALGCLIYISGANNIELAGDQPLFHKTLTCALGLAVQENRTSRLEEVRMEEEDFKPQVRQFPILVMQPGMDAVMYANTDEELVGWTEEKFDAEVLSNAMSVDSNRHSSHQVWIRQSISQRPLFLAVWQHELVLLPLNLFSSFRHAVIWANLSQQIQDLEDCNPHLFIAWMSRQPELLFTTTSFHTGSRILHYLKLTFVSRSCPRAHHSHRSRPWPYSPPEAVQPL